MAQPRVTSSGSAAPAGRRSRAVAALARVACIAAPLALAACAIGPQASPPAQVLPTLFDDARFAPSTAPIDPADVFRLTPEMQAYIDQEIVPTARARGLRAGLTDALYTRSKLQLEYEASTTRNASEAFAARQGNCLSLVIMTGAFAKAMGLTVTFQQVTTDDMWSRSGDLYFMSGHVNLQLERAFVDTVGKFDRYSVYTIDFMPQPETPYVHAHPIAEKTVLAMYMNNRAAEALAVGQLDNAYWRAREAMKLDPKFLSSYNTLGVIYMHHGDKEDAEKVLHYALQLAPDNPRMLANYGEALKRLDRVAEAKAVQARLATIEPYPPFYFYNRGQAAMKAGDMVAAREFFQKEIDREPDYHEFHYALAIADFGLGRIDEARRELALAMEDAVKRTDHDLYAAKLDRLKNAVRYTSPPLPSVQ
ncbi:MAG: tetratricopeptide repeat protein [Betaproteobacteria bacterium]